MSHITGDRGYTSSFWQTVGVSLVLMGALGLGMQTLDAQTGSALAIPDMVVVGEDEPVPLPPYQSQGRPSTPEFWDERQTLPRRGDTIALPLALVPPRISWPDAGDFQSDDLRSDDFQSYVDPTFPLFAGENGDGGADVSEGWTGSTTDPSIPGAMGAGMELYWWVRLGLRQDVRAGVEAARRLGSWPVLARLRGQIPDGWLGMGTYGGVSALLSVSTDRTVLLPALSFGYESLGLFVSGDVGFSVGPGGKSRHLWGV